MSVGGLECTKSIPLDNTVTPIPPTYTKFLAAINFNG